MLGEKLKKLRKQHDLTLQDIANKFNITSATVSAWELNKALPSVSVVKELAKMYDISTDDLLDYSITKEEKLKNALQDMGFTDKDMNYLIKQIELYKEMK